MNQNLIVSKLAAFDLPDDLPEPQYQSELAAYKDYLESRYPLCLLCRQRKALHLEKQQRRLQVKALLNNGQMMLSQQTQSTNSSVSNVESVGKRAKKKNRNAANGQRNGPWLFLVTLSVMCLVRRLGEHYQTEYSWSPLLSRTKQRLSSLGVF